HPGTGQPPDGQTGRPARSCRPRRCPRSPRSPWLPGLAAPPRVAAGPHRAHSGGPAASATPAAGHAAGPAPGPGRRSWAHPAAAAPAGDAECGQALAPVTRPGQALIPATRSGQALAPVTRPQPDMLAARRWRVRVPAQAGEDFEPMTGCGSLLRNGREGPPPPQTPTPLLREYPNTHR